MGPKHNVVLPTRAELRILQVLWERTQATVEEIISHPGLTPRPNYKTTQTILRIMEEKKLVQHANRGRVFVFSPCVTRDEVGRLSVRNLLEQNFGGSPAELLVNLLEASPVNETELQELEALIRDYRIQKGESSR